MPFVFSFALCLLALRRCSGEQARSPAPLGFAACYQRDARIPINGIAQTSSGSVFLILSFKFPINLSLLNLLKNNRCLSASTFTTRHSSNEFGSALAVQVVREQFGSCSRATLRLFASSPFAALLSDTLLSGVYSLIGYCRQSSTFSLSVKSLNRWHHQCPLSF